MLLQVVGTGTTTGTTSYPFSTTSNTFSYMVPAPANAGTYAVTSAYTPNPGNSLGPGASGSTPITVTAPSGPTTPTTITQTVTPTNPAANAPVTVNGTIATTGGTTPSGTVTITVSAFHLFKRMHVPPAMNRCIHPCQAWPVCHNRSISEVAVATP